MPDELDSMFDKANIHAPAANTYIATQKPASSPSKDPLDVMFDNADLNGVPTQGGWGKGVTDDWSMPAAPKKYSSALDYAGKTAASTLDTIGSNIGTAINPMTYVRMLAHPMDNLLNTPDMQKLRDQAKQERELAAKNKEGFFSNNNLASAEHSIEGTVPLLGPMMHGFMETDPSDPHSVGNSLGNAASLYLAPKAAEVGLRTAELAAPAIGKFTGKVAGNTAKLASDVSNNGVSSVASDLMAKINGKASQPSTKLAIQAIRPRASDFNIDESLDTAMPDIKEVAPAGDHDTASFLGKDGKDSLIDQAKALNRQRLDQRIKSAADMPAGLSPEQQQAYVDQFKKNVFQAPNVNVQGVADSIRGALNDRMMEQNPTAAKNIEKIAKTYDDRNMSLEDIDTRKRQAQAELESYYDKYPNAQYKDLLRNPETAHTLLEAQALRKIYQDSLDSRFSGPSGEKDPSGIAELQKRYGALNDLQDSLERRWNVLQRQPENNLPQTLRNAALYGGLGSAGLGLMLGNAETAGTAGIVGGLAGKALEKLSTDYMKKANGTDGLLNQSLKNAKPIGFNPSAAPVKVAGYLGAPTPRIETPDVSGPNPSAAIKQQTGFASSNVGARTLPPSEGNTGPTSLDSGNHVPAFFRTSAENISNKFPHLSPEEASYLSNKLRADPNWKGENDPIAEKAAYPNPEDRPSARRIAGRVLEAIRKLMESKGLGQTNQHQLELPGQPITEPEVSPPAEAKTPELSDAATPALDYLKERPDLVGGADTSPDGYLSKKISSQFKVSKEDASAAIQHAQAFHAKEISDAPAGPAMPVGSRSSGNVYHAIRELSADDNPVKAEDLRSKLGMSPEDFDKAINELKSQGLVVAKAPRRSSVETNPETGGKTLSETLQRVINRPKASSFDTITRLSTPSAPKARAGSFKINISSLVPPAKAQSLADVIRSMLEQNRNQP